MNKFGGDWTENKIEILVEYAKAYLTIMKVFTVKYDWKLLYFDGFAGSGFIKKGNEENLKMIVGAASRILEIENPRAFDLYYFVEKEPENMEAFAEAIDNSMRKQNIYYDDLIEGSVLKPLVIRVLKRDSFRAYMKAQGKLGGQNKVPRLSNDRKIVSALEDMKVTLP